jgi:ankyrin repeat protein
MDKFENFEKIVYDNDFDTFKEEVLKLDDINIQNKYGWTLLHVAIRRDRRDMVNFLLDNGADINKIDGVGWTPLMEAIMDDMPELVSILVDRGADKTIANARGATAPMLAQKFGRVNMYDTLA